MAARTAARGWRRCDQGTPPNLPVERFGDDASWAFDEEAVRRYQLVLTPENWEALKASALAEQYFPAPLHVKLKFGAYSDNRWFFGLKWLNNSIRCRATRRSFTSGSPIRRSAGTVRIGIDSLLYSQYESRAVFGWDVRVDGSQQRRELALADATYPKWGADAISREDAPSQATALLFEPRVVAPKDRGSDPSFARDVGQLRIDRIVFSPLRQR